MTKITFITGEYPPMQGGIADYTAHLAHQLQTLDIEPSILISQKYQQHLPTPQTAIPNNSQWSAVGGHIPVYSHLKSWNWRCWQEIKAFLNTHNPDVLHIQYQAAAFDLGGWINWLPWYLKRLTHCPQIVTTFHDLRIPYLFPKAGKLRWWSVLALARYSDAVICTNLEDATILQQYPWGKHINQIPLGNNVAVNPPSNYNRQQWRKRLGLSEDAFILAYFGFLNESKGGEDLIATLAALRQQKLNAYLLIIGGDIGDSDPTNIAYAKRIKSLISTHNLTNYIIFTGYVELEAVSANLLAADVAVMPYRDGVSFRRTTLIAALQHGLPIISTSPTMPIPELVPNKNMLLVPPKDINGLTNAVLTLANDKNLSHYLSKESKKLGQPFDWQEIAIKTAQIYTP